MKNKNDKQTVDLIEDVNPCLCDEITQAIEERNRQRLEDEHILAQAKELEQSMY